MSEATETAPDGGTTETTAAPTAIDRALDAFTKPADTPSPEKPAAAPAAPPVPPPETKATPDPDAVRKAQEAAHAATAAKIERDRAEVDAARKALDADRKAIGDAQRLAKLAKDDPARFLRETGHDALDFAKRVAERERVTDAARGELDSLAAQNAALAKRLEAFEAAQTSAQKEGATRARGEAIAQIREVAKAKHPAAAHYMTSAQMDEGYLDALADEIRAERGHVSLDAVSERLDLRMREAFRTMAETPWGREMAAGLAKPPTTTQAPTGQDASRAAKEPPKTLTRSTTDDRSSAPRDDRETRMNRALDMFLGSKE